MLDFSKRVLASTAVIAVSALVITGTSPALAASPSRVAPGASSAFASARAVKTTLSLSSTNVATGARFTASGTSLPYLATSVVRIQEKIGAKWVNVGSAKVAKNGKFSTTLTVTKVGGHIFRAVTEPRNRKYSGTASGSRSLSALGWIRLSRLDAVLNWYESDTTFEIDGNSYPISPATWVRESENRKEFLLKRGCTRFEATAGVTDDSESTAKARIGVNVDQHSVFEKQASYGAGHKISVNITNGLRLGLVVSGLGDLTHVGFGDARILCNWVPAQS